jgi:hypothetical protein
MVNKQKVPRIQGPITDNTQPFKWVIDGDYANFESKTFGLTSCFEDGAFNQCIYPQLKLYSNQTWGEILKNPHNHYMDIQNIISNELRDIYIKLEIETAYQLSVPIHNAKHRIWGMRGGQVFYLIADDPNHIGYKTHKKHT